MAAKKSSASKVPAVSKVVASTPVRNSAVPPKSVAAPASRKMSVPTFEEISLRAYYISRSGTGGSEDENWLRAERELRSGV